ncbi:ABC transporter ATP-binding protein [Tissierella sp. MB52-C2]|uniref:ABC transporter ATP-binding protein n=1 Tax=Tissierella sp. MB52-C2 TaxID=3070999 RepID=UPI00280C10BD|nr:ABC transporter ATP-binding protein [Tissierella sp. MB52-C2]WMM23755.1 ABC transporter ATP-binding protein [Tissierella sp. MB52-C2]
MKRTINKSIGYLILAFLVLTIGIALDGYLSIGMMKIIDSALEGNMTLFKNEAIKIFILIGLSLPFSILISYTRGIYIYKSLIKTKITYVERLFGKNINEFQAENNGVYLSSMTNDMNNIEKKYLEGIYEVGNSLIGFLISFIVIASVSPAALFIGIGVSIISVILSMAVGKPLQRHEKHRAELFEGYTSYIKEVLGAFQIIKSNNLNEKIKEDFYNKSEDIQYKGYTIDKIHTYTLSIQQFIMYASTFAILLISAAMAIKGSITTGAVILIVNNMSRVIFPLMNLAEWFPKIFSVKSLFIKLDESLKNHDNYEETVDLNSFNNTIEFQDVSFSYDNKEILADINLSITKGEKYLVIGPSGGGKSTLLKLLRKYFNPTEGKILVDGKNLKDIKKESYFKNISNVEQQVFLFEDTLRNNITLYKDYNDDEINFAIDKAGLKDFLKALPNGLDTMIYDNGKNISGGERSRIAIARGLLTKSDIIFLDEAFASLDSSVAREIENTLLNLEGVTVINVSHVIFEETKNEYNNIFVVKNKAII